MRRGVLLIPLALALAAFALSPAARAVDPAPDGGYPNQNTAEGDDALFSLTTGINNTANGFNALYYNTTGYDNTAIGYLALAGNITGGGNTAIGYQALYFNPTGYDNTAIGAQALGLSFGGNNNTAIGAGAMMSFDSSSGSNNTATGALALWNITGGSNNTATGYNTLQTTNNGSNNTATGVSALQNSDADNNTANGYFALNENESGFQNTADGGSALISNTQGNSNTAIGFNALLNNTTGSNNIALGFNAGSNLTTGSNNIDIGALGAAGESNTTRIGKKGTQKTTYIAGINGATVAGGVGVIIDTFGRLGTVVSSERFKDQIKPMDKASEAILALKPVTFRYKHELDPDGIPQFGLVAEQVEKVNPDLVACDDQGKPYTVRYEAVNAMLLNEFLKEHRKVEEQGQKIVLQDRKGQEQAATITQLKSAVAHQQKQIEALTAGLQKVNAQVEMSKPAPQMVLNNQ